MHIIGQVLSGKTEAFAYFLDTYGQQVFALIVRMVSSPEYAEELTQDTFMKAFRHLDSFAGESSFSTWIYRIAYNTALLAVRKKHDEVLMIDDRQWERVSETEIDEALDEDSEERIACLQAALLKLTPEERALVTLFYEEDKSIDEIAGILKQTVANVKVKLYRVRKKLYVLMKSGD